MERIHKQEIILPFLILMCSLIPVTAVAQQPNPPSDSRPEEIPGVYLLSITPYGGGKSYTLFHRTKVIIKMTDGREIKGKVRGVSLNEISIDYKSYPIDGIGEIRFTPGSSLGLVAAGALLVGMTAVAITASTGTESATEEVIFWSGLGLAAAGFITLIPTHFIKKSFNSTEYQFTAVLVGSY
jgi:hypothetical protein